MKRMKRSLCLLLALVMVLGYIPGAIQTAASQEDGLCEKHHSAHTAECGYAEVAGCSHEGQCGENCLQPVTRCVFVHEGCGCTPEVPPQDCGGSCQLAVQKAAVKCSCPENEDGSVTHDAAACDYQARLAEVESTYSHDEACGYSEGSAAQFCGHNCTEESACVTMQCGHTHDENCGYSQGAACQFAGQECQLCAAEQTPAPASDAQTLPMYTRIGSGDENGNVTYDYLDSMTLPGNSNGPWLNFVPDRNSTTAFSEFTSSDTSIVDLEYNDEEHVNLRFLLGNEGTATITHTEADGTVYSFTVTVIKPEEPTLRYRVNDENYPMGGTWSLAPGAEVRVKFYIGTNAQTNIDQGNETFSLNNMEVADSTIVELTGPDTANFYTVKGLEAGSTTLSAVKDGKTYTLTVTVQEPRYYLLITPNDNPNSISLTGLTEPVDVNAYITTAGPANGYQILSGLTSGDTSVVTVSDPVEGVFTVTPVGGGSTTLSYTDESGKVYSQNVSVLGQLEDEGLLYFSATHGQSGQTYPKTCVNMNPGDSLAQKFYFGNTLLTTDTEGFSWSGPIDVVQLDDGRLSVEPYAAGTGYLEYTADGITHCFVVNVGRSAPDTEVAEGGYMWFNDDVVLRFGDPRLDTPDAGVMEMLAQASGGFGITTPSTHVFRKAVAFAAQNQTEGVPEKSLMDSVENVNFSILCCNNSDTSGEYVVSVEKEECEVIQLTNGLTAYTNYLVAGGTVPFVGLVGMTFDIPDTNAAGETITRRISLYLLTHNTLQRDVSVDADDINTAAELNAILSSYEALLKWVKAKYPGYDDVVDSASHININLPGGDFTDTVVVSQAIATCPFEGHISGNPNFRVYLYGSASGKATKMAGLISRGSLTAVMNVEFEAQADAVMTMNGEEFTCGLLADSSWSADVLGGIKYDKTLLELYGDTNGDGTFSSEDQRRLSGNFANLDCDIMTVMNCSFTGFDYGTRSTPNGYVGSGMGNSFQKCFYGIYIDCEGKPGWSNYAHTGFSYYDFKKNVVAVRIKGLQDNATPYNFRIQDSDFINNYLEFWIEKYDTTYLQNYYFYRNHYSGGWNKPTGNWHKYGSSTLGNESIPEVDHRGPKYSEEMLNGVGIYVSGTPSRSIANLETNRSASEESYWIYSGDDQVTRILDDQDMPLAQQSLETLTSDANVSVVDARTEDTIAVWTFEGGE